MGFWNTLLKYGGKTLTGTGTAVGATGRSVGSAVLHPTRTLKNVGNAAKTAAIGAGMGYVGWEKLTTDKSVARIVSETVIGETATENLSSAVSDIKDLKGKAGDMVDTVNGAVEELGGKMNGISSFVEKLASGNGANMFSNFLNNLTKGNVSGLSTVGLIAAGFLIFGRFGWLGKIAGAMLAMMLIGNNALTNRQQEPVMQRQEEETPQRIGIRR